VNRRIAFACAVAAVSSLPCASFAQTYPERPVTIIVPFAAGGGSDNIARLIAAKLTEKSGKTFIIDNRHRQPRRWRNQYRQRAG